MFYFMKCDYALIGQFDKICSGLAKVVHVEIQIGYKDGTIPFTIFPLNFAYNCCIVASLVD